MLTLKDHPPEIDKDNGIIKIWNNSIDSYETHSFEFIETLYELIKE